jgi:hypothetical protein
MRPDSPPIHRTPPTKKGHPMNDVSVTPGPKPDQFAEIAAALRALTVRFTDLIGSDLPLAVTLHVQPSSYGDDDAIVRAVDAVTSALLGHGGQVQEMSNGTYHYNNGVATEPVGPIGVRVYSSVSTEFAVKRQAAAVLAEREAELEKLRAEVEALRSAVRFDANGLGYSREADDPTPVSPARVPLHTGGVIDDGQLIDETADADPDFHVGELVAVDGDQPGDPPWRITAIVTDDPRHDGPFAQLEAIDGSGSSWSALRILRHTRPTFDASEAVPPADLPPGHAPHDGHVYECCGKVGRISRHEPWCNVYRIPDQSASAS